MVLRQLLRSESEEPRGEGQKGVAKGVGRKKKAPYVVEARALRKVVIKIISKCYVTNRRFNLLRSNKQETVSINPF